MAHPAATAVVRALGAALLATPANVASLLLYAHNQLHRPGSIEALAVEVRGSVGEPHVVPVLTPELLFREGVQRLFPGRLIGLTVLAQNNAVPLKTDKTPRVFSLLSLTFATKHAEVLRVHLDDTFFNTPRFWRRGADFAPAMVALGTMLLKPDDYWELVNDGEAAAHLVCQGFRHLEVLRGYYAPAAWLLTDLYLLFERLRDTAPNDRRFGQQAHEAARKLQPVLAPAQIPWAAGLPKPEDAEALTKLRAALARFSVPGDAPAFMRALDGLAKGQVAARMRALRESFPKDLHLLPNGGRGTEDELYYAALPMD